MKLITPLFSDPVGWAEFIAKTPVRIIFAISIHIAFVYWGFNQIADRFIDQPHHDVSALDLMMISFPITFIGIVYPALYFIAKHLLLKKIRAKEKQAEPEA